MAIVLPKKLTQDKASRSGREPPTLNHPQESDEQEDAEKSNGSICETEHAILEDESSNRETILSAYLDLQTPTPLDLGDGRERTTDAKDLIMEDERDQALTLLNIIKYIQYLEKLQRCLLEEKSALEDRVSAWERMGAKGGGTT